MMELWKRRKEKRRKKKRRVRRRIIPRRSWTTSGPGGTAFSKSKGLAFLHHTAGPMPEGGRNAKRRTEEALIRGTRAFHMSGRGYSDIAYNYGQMPSGRSYELRGFRTGGHTYGYNETSLALVFFGNYEIVRPSQEAVEGASFVFKRLMKKKRLTKTFSLRLHSDVGAQGGSTACPGKFVAAERADIRRAA